MHKECQSNSAKKDFMKSGNMKSHGDVSLENCNNFHMHCMNNKTTPFGPLWGNLFLFNLQRKQTHANLHHIYIFTTRNIYSVCSATKLTRTTRTGTCSGTHRNACNTEARPTSFVNVGQPTSLVNSFRRKFYLAILQAQSSCMTIPASEQVPASVPIGA